MKKYLIGCVAISSLLMTGVLFADVVGPRRHVEHRVNERQHQHHVHKFDRRHPDAVPAHMYRTR